MYQDYAGQGYYYIGIYAQSVSTMATEMTQQRYSPDNDITNFYYDPGDAVLGLYASALGHLASRPHTYLVDRDGNVRVSYGAVMSNEAKWRGWIEELL